MTVRYRDVGVLKITIHMNGHSCNEYLKEIYSGKIIDILRSTEFEQHYLIDFLFKPDNVWLNLH